MHMSDALISPAVSITMTTVAMTTLAYAVRKLQKSDQLTEDKITMMGIMGAFVFACQMINFTIPGTGSSGHIGGGLLLAAILGPAPAYITMAIILLIQALFFADGGLMAWGCNVINMGLLTSVLAYTLIYKPITRNNISIGKINTASIIAATIGLILGATSVVIQTHISQITELPIETFLSLMVPVHIVIGIVEGIITGAVLTYIYKTKKEYLYIEQPAQTTQTPSNTTKIKSVIIISTIITAGILSLYASQNPDGLEWAVAKTTNDKELTTTSTAHQQSEKITEKIAIMPDYALKSGNHTEATQTATAGITGSIITIILTILTGYIIRKTKKCK
ncbi:MAG: energy-coupling factor ABC transporter permease [Synergistaceae bacterium]